MTSVDQIKNALATLTAQPEESVAVIDAEIEQLEVEIAQLRRVRKTLTKGERVARAKPKAGAGAGVGTGKLSHWSEAEQQVFDYVSANGKATSSDIAEELGLTALHVGKAVASSQRLTKDGSYVVLVD